MDAIFHLFKIPLILSLFVVVSVLVLALVPSSLFKHKKIAWTVLLSAALAVGLYTWFYVQPEQYERSYIQSKAASYEPLKEIADRRNFYVGAAISNTPEQMKSAKPYFNSLTLENGLKYGKLIGNDLKTYDFSQADPLVNFALRNNMRIRGHVLVWGRAADFFKSPDLRMILKDVPKERMPDTLQSLIRSHITTMLDRYRGKIMQWDCVNEPLNVFDGGFDNNIYYEYLGKDYIKNSFKWAHEVDPKVALYLNEQFDQYDSEKAEAFLILVKELVDEGVPIHGVGIQAHAMFQIPEMEPFRAFIAQIAHLGLKIEITELDARLRLFNDFADPYRAQGAFYKEFTEACLDNPACTGITLWGVTDKISWYDKMGVFNLHRPNEPLLFDSKMTPKPAYFGILDAMKDK